MPKVVPVPRAAVEFQAPDVAVAGRILRRIYHQVPAAQVHRRFPEQGRAQRVLIAAGAHGIEPQCTENVPGRCLAVVLIAAITVGPGRVELFHDLPHAGLGLPGLAAPVVQVQHVLDGLVAVGVVAHTHHRHLHNLVDGEAVVGVVVERRHGENAVQFGGEGFRPAHQLHQTGNVVKDAPGVVEAVPFGEVASPFERVERPTEGAVCPAPVHQAKLRVKEMPIVLCRGLVRRQLGLRLPQRLPQLPDAPVGIGIFQGAGGAFRDAGVAGHVTQTVVQPPAGPSGGTHAGVLRMGPMGDGLPEHVHVLAADAFEVGIGHDRSAVVPHHAVPVAGRGPFRQETALLVMVHQPLLDADGRFRIHQVHQRQQGPEGVPEAGVGVKRPAAHLAVMRAIVDFVPCGVGL